MRSQRLEGERTAAKWSETRHVARLHLLMVVAGMVCVSACSLVAPAASPEHPGDKYGSECIECTSNYNSAGDPFARDEAAADLLRPALMAAGPPTSVDPSSFHNAAGFDAADPYFVWNPANGWFTLHDVPADARITQVQVLLGGYFRSGDTDVLVELDGRTDTALDYKIDKTTMGRIADVLLITAPCCPPSG